MEIIAEVALNHHGSLPLACAYIDAIAEAGADTAKFQYHSVLYEPNRPLRVPIHGHEDRHSLWRATSFSLAEWQYLRAYCARREVGFLVSVFCPESVETLSGIGVRRFKVPSGQLTNIPLLDALAARQTRVLLSTGLHPLAEVEMASERLQGALEGILSCVTSYPSVPSQIRLDWDGLSDHSGTVWPGVLAAWEGQRYLEVHVCFSRDTQEPDAEASLEFWELEQLCLGVSFAEDMRNAPASHDDVVATVRHLRPLFVPNEPCPGELP